MRRSGTRFCLPRSSYSAIFADVPPVPLGCATSVILKSTPVTPTSLPARSALLLALAALIVAAQYPGQYPGGGYPGQYPPGTYPPGSYPPGSYPPGRYPGGSRYPGDRRQPTGRRGSSKKEPAAIPITTDGMLRLYTGNRLIIQPDDHRIVWYHVSGETTFKGADLKDLDMKTVVPGDHVTVDSLSDDEGIYTAVAVRFDKAGTAEERTEARAQWDLPTGGELGAGGQARPAGGGGSGQPRGDDERPILRRTSGGGDGQQSKTADSTEAAKPQGGGSEQGSKPAPSAPAAATTASAEPPAIEQPGTVMRPPEPPSDQDDPGRPALKRGKGPAPRKPVQVADSRSGGESAPSSTTEPAILTKEKPAEERRAGEGSSSAPAAGPAAAQQRQDELIEKVRAAAVDYLGSLPNFLCQQMTTRYTTEDAKRGWDAHDIVSADVTYEDGRENYRNIKINNKPVNKEMAEIGGSRSTGEFATILRAILTPGSGAEFRRLGGDTISGHQAIMFAFQVSRDRSGWRISAPSQLYYPAFKGTIWVDKETYLVLRIEQQARNMPSAFPFDAVESAVDYAGVRLGTAQSYLLPVDAEVMTCQRGTSLCQRNRIEFRNYRKFGAESNITFGN
jgi:hypothetical protein